LTQKEPYFAQKPKEENEKYITKKEGENQTIAN
jgi:hypothetical protein